MAIIETPVLYNRLTGQNVIKETPPSWIDKVVDFATGFIHGIQEPDAVSETNTMVLLQQEAALKREQDKKLFFYGAIGLLIVIALTKK